MNFYLKSKKQKKSSQSLENPYQVDNVHVVKASFARLPSTKRLYSQAEQLSSSHVQTNTTENQCH